MPAHDLVQGTVDDLPGDDSWNAILSVNVLEHIQEDERELAIYRRKLARARGTLCLFVPARPGAGRNRMPMRGPDPVECTS